MPRQGLYHKLQQITNCDGRDSQIDLNSARWYTPKLQKRRSHRHRTISRSFPWYIVYGHYNTNRYTSEITPEWAKMHLFIFMSNLFLTVQLAIKQLGERTSSDLKEVLCTICMLIVHIYSQILNQIKRNQHFIR